MKKSLKKIATNFIDFSLYKILNQKNREYLVDFLTDDQKNTLKKYLRLGKSQSLIQQIEIIKHYMNSLGFTERGLSHLESILRNNKGFFQKRYAAKELSLWYANNYEEKSASKCLTIIENHLSEVKESDFEREIAIMKAEAYNLIGDTERANEIIKKTLNLTSNSHPDVLLAASNLETSIVEKEKYINRIFDLYGLSNISLDTSKVKSIYDSLRSVKKENCATENMPKVTILVPMYNSEDTIETSLESLISQTWTNLEIIAVDDCSSDRTVEKVSVLARQDSRIKLIQAKTNGGAYTARNLGLQEATGDFITINDADDWSHPEKIEKQVKHLMKNSRIVGNMSQQARATNELLFYRRGKFGIYIFSNMSSFMFRREKVIKEIGFWDSVRFGADSEYIKRIKKVFGPKSVVHLNSGPLSFQRQTDTSLTGNSAFGFPGFFMGARKEYVESHEYFHKKTSSIYYSFPLEKRMFPVPEPMLPNRMAKGTRRKLDTIIVSDFRQNSAVLERNVDEIKKCLKQNKQVGLIQLYKYDLSPNTNISPLIRELMQGENVQLLVFGEEITCNTLLILNISILKDFQKYVPRIIADEMRVLINEVPERGIKTLDEIDNYKHQLIAYFGGLGVWYPESADIRKRLEDYSFEQLDIPLAEDNWDMLKSF